MNHETTIKQIQELVPNVMALEFGCEVKLKHTFRKVRNAKVLAHMGGGCFQVQERIDTSKNEEEYKKDYGHCEITDYEPDSFEIIGSPITIAVILLALYKISDNNFYVSYEGNIVDGTDEDIYSNWNLSKDNFNDQSEETKTFIGELFN